MKVPETFWPTIVPFIQALTAVLVALGVILQSRIHSGVIEVKKELAVGLGEVKQEVAIVKAATNGINTELQKKITAQESDRVLAATITEKDKAIVEAEHSPQK